MNKLRHSRAAKITAFILAIVFICAAAGNAIAAIYLIDQNLYSNSKEATERAVYRTIAKQSADYAYSYYTNKLLRENNDSFSSYWENEEAIYKSKMSNENSNIALEIKDNDGNSVFNSFDMPNPHYTFDFSYNYSYQSYSEDYDTTVSAPPEEYYDTTVADTIPDEAVTKPFTEEATTSFDIPEEATTGFGVQEESTTASIEYTLYSATISVADSTIPFKYYYQGTAIDTDILAYCLNRASVMYTDYGAGNITFYQDNYENIDGEIRYKHTDKETTTQLDKDAGSIQVDFTVTVFVPENMSVHSDMFYYASILVNLVDGIKHFLIPATVIFLLLSIILIVFLIYSAGFIRDDEETHAGGIHKIPFDLYLVISIAVGLLMSVLPQIGNSNYFLAEVLAIIFVIIAVIAIIILCIALCMTFAVRLRTHTLISNNITTHIIKAIIKLFRFASANIAITWKALLIWGGISVIEIILLIAAYSSNETAVIAIPFILAKIAEIPLLFILISNMYLLQKGAENISNGNTSYKIENKLLFGEFKKHANYLNNINNGINKAVSERMKSESMKTELITNVSHDLKTPLTSIVNYVDLLKKTGIDNEKAEEYIEVIDRQSQRLKKLTFDIVEASKAATGNIEVHNEKTQLNVFLSQINGEYSDRLTAKNLILIDEIPQEEIYIDADGRLLWRVIDNLLGNICKYAMPSTRVYLTLLSKGGNAQIIFRNISGKELNVSPEELTERFVRGDSSRNTEGSGLGLSIAKSLTEIMGGHLDIVIDGDLFKVILTFGIIN